MILIQSRSYVCRLPDRKESESHGALGGNYRTPGAEHEIPAVPPADSIFDGSDRHAEVHLYAEVITCGRGLVFTLVIQLMNSCRIPESEL